MAFSKARRLSDFIAADGTIPTGKFASGTITSAHIANLGITHADLHTNMDLTGKTVLVANASTGDNDTTAANTAFVQQEIAALVDSSPSALNTLNELAAALGDDANFSTTVNTNIATKLPLAGGTLTGDLTISEATPTLKFTDTDNNYDATIAGLSGSLVLTADSGAEFGTETIQFHTGGSQKVTIDASGNVLVGKTSSGVATAGHELFANGTAWHTKASGNPMALSRLTDDGSILEFYEASTLVGSIGTSSGMFIGSTYGTDSGLRFASSIIAPSTTTGANRDAAIDLGYSSSRFKNLWMSGNANLGSSSYLRFQAAASGSDGVLLFGTTSGTGGSLTFKRNSDNAALVKVQADGKVGIGTTTPISPLHVENGAQSLSHTYIYDESAISVEATEPSIQLMAEDSGTHGGSLLWRYGNNAFAAIANPTTDAIDFTYGVTTANDFQVHSGTNMSSYLKIMSIGADGKVGIGEASPGKTLDVEGAIRAKNSGGSAAAELDITSGATWRFRSNPTSGTNNYGLDIIKGGAGTDIKMSIDTNGKVGIGTSSPATKFDIKNPGDNTYTGGLLIRTGTSTSEASSLYHDNNSATTTVLANRYDNAGAAIKLILRASSGSPVTALTALGSGNVGIGEASPDSPLHVAGRLHHKRSTGTTHTGASSTSHPISDVSIIGSKLRWSLEVYFANGASGYGIRVYVNQTSLWLAGEVCIGSTYSNASATGLNRYSFNHNYNGSNNYGNVLTQTESFGQVASHFTLDSHGWDSTESAHYFEFRHNTSSGNHMYLQFEGMGSTPAHANMATWYYKHITF